MTFDEWWQSLDGTEHRHNNWYVTPDSEWISEETVREIWDAAVAQRLGVLTQERRDEDQRLQPGTD